MNDLNYSPEAITVIISGLIVLVGCIFIGRTAYLKKVNLYWLFFFSFLSWSIAFILMGLSRIFLNILINRIEYIFIISSIFFLLIAIDFSMRESINPYKMLYVGIIGAMLIYFTWQPDAFVESTLYGYPSFMVSYQLRIILGLVLLTYGFSLCHFIFVIYLKSPMSLKRDALILLIGSLIIGIVTPIFLILTDLVFTVPIGVIIMAYVFVKEPKIFYILPFEAHRLTIVHNITEMALFDYKWSETEKDIYLLPRLVLALNQLSIDVLKKGDIEEVILSSGILLFHKSRNITCGLVASKASKYLKGCLERFAIAFEKQFEMELSEMTEAVENLPYFLANDLVDEIFSGVPSRV